ERLHRQLARLWRGANQPERALEAYRDALGEEDGASRWRLQRALGAPHTVPASFPVAGAADPTPPTGDARKAPEEGDASRPAGSPVPAGTSGADASSPADRGGTAGHAAEAPQSAEENGRASPEDLSQRPEDAESRAPTPVEAQRPLDEDA